jgi:hypothetical protein
VRLPKNRRVTGRGPICRAVVFLGVAWCVAASFLPAQAQRNPDSGRPPRLSPAEAERQGRELVAELLSRQPEPATNTGSLRIRARGQPEKEFRVRFEIYLTRTNWVSSYEVMVDPQSSKTVKLTVIHEPGNPNQYLLQEGGGSARRLTPDETMTPFASSEFWVADLGLEFLRWPKQLVRWKELRKSQSCDVLESINPDAHPIGYSRVVSWIDIDTGGIVHAEAFDKSGELLKQFDPTALQKVNGKRQLKEMEIRNRKTGARSWIDFNPGSE